MQPADPASTVSDITTEVIRVRGLTFTYPNYLSERAAARCAGNGLHRRPRRCLRIPGPQRRREVHHPEASYWPAARPRWRDGSLAQGSAGWGSDYYQRIGVSFELPNHYQKLTGLENLRFFASLYVGETLDPTDLLEAVGLADDADTRVGEYSKGMQMRLTFARSLINHPERLFLDEPTSGLHPVNAGKVKNMATPVPLSAFFAYRAATVMGVTTVYVVTPISFSGISEPGLVGSLIPIGLLAGLSAVVTMLLILAMASNKIRGLAMLRALGMLIAGLPCLPWFIDSGWNLAFVVLPPYWAAKAFWAASDHGTWWPYLCVGVVCNLAVAWLLFRRFLAKNA